MKNCAFNASEIEVLTFQQRKSGTRKAMDNSPFSKGNSKYFSTTLSSQRLYLR